MVWQSDTHLQALQKSSSTDSWPSSSWSASSWSSDSSSSSGSSRLKRSPTVQPFWILLVWPCTVDRHRPRHLWSIHVILGGQVLSAGNTGRCAITTQKHSTWQCHSWHLALGTPKSLGPSFEDLWSKVSPMPGRPGMSKSGRPGVSPMGKTSWFLESWVCLGFLHRQTCHIAKNTDCQWIGLRENLQETMVFTIKYRGFL